MRADERNSVARGLARHPRVDVELLDETSFVPELGQFEPVGRWSKQMLLKLAFARVARSDFYVTLDADVVCVRSISERMLLPDDRALTEWEAEANHPQLVA